MYNEGYFRKYNFCDSERKTWKSLNKPTQIYERKNISNN